MIFDVFAKVPYPPDSRQEVHNLLDELVQIGKKEGFLSERPGGAFNAQCRQIRARDIGERLDELGGFDLMEFIYRRIKKKLGAELATHLEFSWAGIGDWLP